MSPLAAGGASFHYALRDANGIIDMGRRTDVCAVSWLYANSEQEMTLLLGPCINPRLWLNGQVVHGGGPFIEAAGDPVAVKVRLHAGWNTLVARRLDKSGSGFLSIHLEPTTNHP